MTRDRPDILCPPGSLWASVAQRIATGRSVPAPADLTERWIEPPWEEVAPGISYQPLAHDAGTGRISMLVRLAPDVEYPPHRHADVEELHLLDGELVIDDRQLHPGDYYCAAEGTADARVWSRTGCTCVLIASMHDVLR